MYSNFIVIKCVCVSLSLSPSLAMLHSLFVGCIRRCGPLRFRCVVYDRLYHLHHMPSDHTCYLSEHEVSDLS